jgi:hypothetical protein
MAERIVGTGLSRLISQPPELPKERTDFLRIPAEWWDRHQALDSQMRKLPAGLEQRQEVSFDDAGLTGLSLQVHLYENSYLLP